MTDSLLQQLNGDHWERLRWLVCRRLGVPPWRPLSRKTVLKCALHLALDAQDPPPPDTERADGSSFDFDRFRQLGGRC